MGDSASVDKPASARVRTAVVCIAKDEDLYLPEWLDYHLRLGFDDAYVYMNDWRYTGRVPDIPGHSVTTVEFDGRKRQLAAYNDFIARFSDKYDWVAFIDVDEYFANNSGGSFVDVLARYSGFPQLAVNWRVMGDSGITSFDPSNVSLALRFTKGSARLNHHVKQLVNFRWFRQSGKAMPEFKVNPHCTSVPSFCQGGYGVPAQFNEFGLDAVQPLELYHYLVKTRQEFDTIRFPRGRADTAVREYTKDRAEMDWNVFNVNEAEFTTVRDFYAGVRDTCGSPQGQAVGGVAQAPADGLSVVFVYPSGKGLAAKVGMVKRPDGLDWHVHALPIFRELEKRNDMRVVEIGIDTMPLTTVDQIVAGSGFPPPDLLILDARGHGVPVLYGAMHTLRECRPVLVFSANPPGVAKDYDTVEHYMRFVDIMADVHYWLLHRPSRWDHVMQYAEVSNG